MRKTQATLSLDLDNQWSYMKTHGDAGWESFPTYLETVVPRFNAMLDELGVKMTVFVVGQDAALEKNHAALRQIPEAGHEVGNHSFHHEPWLHLYSPEEIEAEVERAEEAIREATGVRPRGWRGPGFSFSKPLLNVLSERGYQYDCSTFPTYMGPLARTFYFFTAKMPKEEREKRKQLFGKFSEGFRPLKPYQWETSGGHLLEIPVTTFPVFKIPIHASYILYFASFNKLAALTYFKTAIAACKLAGVQPSLLLHPLDFLGADDCEELAFFPAMSKGSPWKIEVMREILTLYSNAFDVVPLREYAAWLCGREGLSAKQLPNIGKEYAA